MLRKHRQSDGKQRSGAVTVEMAVVIPVFAMFLAGIMEFGHAYLIIGTLNAAARQSARLGAAQDATTAATQARCTAILNAGFDASEATIMIKDASVFDDGTTNPASIDYASLPDATLENMETRDMFIVRVVVPYDSVALLPPFWAKNITLSGQSVMRHE